MLADIYADWHHREKNRATNLQSSVLSKLEAFAKPMQHLTACRQHGLHLTTVRRSRRRAGGASCRQLTSTWRTQVGNYIDPIYIDAALHIFTQEVCLDGGFISDGLPLCDGAHALGVLTK